MNKPTNIRDDNDLGKNNDLSKGTNDATAGTSLISNVDDLSYSYSVTLQSDWGGVVDRMSDESVSGGDLATRIEESWTYVKDELRKIKDDNKLDKVPSNASEQRSVTSLAKMLENAILEVLHNMEDVEMRHTNLAKLEDLVQSSQNDTELPETLRHRKLDFEQAQTEVVAMLAEVREICYGVLTSEASEEEEKNQQEVQVQKKAKVRGGNAKKGQNVAAASRQYMQRSNQIELQLPDFFTASGSDHAFGADVLKNERELLEVMRKGDDLVFGPEKVPKSKLQ